jgi:hypothetical protein
MKPQIYKGLYGLWYMLYQDRKSGYKGRLICNSWSEMIGLLEHGYRENYIERGNK